ncbi:type I restriction enzyme HsdR N-terminal domain-containing protein [Burkholderia guangdongensis]|uniref:type I restriction enzyme HsdR N-terminal domain-containing protein n=1 Tax=Burkholderia guangdongensis TaxID=1792500 RepID=UPI0015C820A5|nr:type I restriction enzyme HsdR N-terminal domain-containing protein [Burkholderia guangdongensis]
MSPTDIFAQPIAFETLQLYKRLEPLAHDVMETLRQIERLDVSGFTEAEVRAYVIDPIVRALGYAKGTDFSVDLERKIEFLGKNKFPDYKLNLWQEDFWLIEAKRPRTNEAFGYEDLAQAIEYACHPKINAALVVLCDGIKIEVFDREMSVTEPVIRMPRDRLVSEFDKLRHLLEPWQMWFFQKRRVVRLIDKVFDREFNMNRVEEFKKLVDDRLAGKRTLILDNFRKQVSSDSQGERDLIKSASMEDLIEMHMFQQHSTSTTNALTAALADKSAANTFHVPYRMLPDKARDLSDIYVGHALAYLMELDRRGVATVQFLPNWLAPGAQMNADLKAAIGRFIRLCLTYFDSDEPRRLILLAATAYRRVFKVLLMLSESQWAIAEARHFIQRFETPERTWSQIVGSPEGHALGMLNASAMMATYRFVNGLQPDDSAFKVEIAKLQLRQIWDMEKKLLGQVLNYPKIRKERDLGEMHPTEWCCVTYDFLGHLVLCLLPSFPEWKEYILQNHLPEVTALAKLQSWAAKQLLGMDISDQIEAPDDQFLADRFFLGDVETLRLLRARYNGNAVAAVT